MKERDLLELQKRHGRGASRELTKEQLKSLQDASNSFRKSLVDSCISHALYRCNLTCVDGIVYILISGSDENGNMKELQVGYNLESGEVATSKIVLEGSLELGKSILNMLMTLSKLPRDIGMLDIPMEGKFEEGIITNYNKEEGTVLIIIKDSLDNSFFTEL